MSNYLIQGETLTGIADAIRAKSGSSDAIKVSDFATQIEEIEGSGGGGAEEVETSVALDFSGGDMEVTPNDGEAFSKVSIPKPSTLVAENIAEGIDIAGIVGTLASGGSIKVASGMIEGNDYSSTYTLAHNLGVIPDIFYFATNDGTSNGYIVSGFGVSSAFSNLYGITYNTSFYCSSNLVLPRSNLSYLIDSTSTWSIINNANEQTINIKAASTRKLPSEINWIAIGGLT